MTIYKLVVDYYLVEDDEFEDQTSVTLNYFRTEENARKCLKEHASKLIDEFTPVGSTTSMTVKKTKDSYTIIFDYGEQNRIYTLHVWEIELAD